MIAGKMDVPVCINCTTECIPITLTKQETEVESLVDFAARLSKKNMAKVLAKLDTEAGICRNPEHTDTEWDTIACEEHCNECNKIKKPPQDKPEQEEDSTMFDLLHGAIKKTGCGMTGEMFVELNMRTESYANQKASEAVARERAEIVGMLLDEEGNRWKNKSVRPLSEIINLIKQRTK